MDLILRRDLRSFIQEVEYLIVVIEKAAMRMLPESERDPIVARLTEESIMMILRLTLALTQIRAERQ